MKNNYIIKKIFGICLLIILSIFLFSCKNNQITINNEKENNIKINNFNKNDLKEKNVGETDKQKIETKTEKIKEEKSHNKICDWINKSDIIIKLDLPKEYINNSYPLGFLLKDKYNLVFRDFKLARKDCDYKVGFSNDEVKRLIENGNKNSPIILASDKGKSEMFTYKDAPTIINFSEDDFSKKHDYILKVTGVVSAYDFQNKYMK